MKHVKFIILLLGFILFHTGGEAQNVNDDYTIIADSTNIYPTIDSILKLDKLQNKVVYVDIWGTRCSPCLREFAYLPALKEKFANDSVAFLYLCCPYSLKWDKQNEKRWLDLIIKNELKGVNVFISPECYGTGFFEKYKDNYTEERRYTIPTYLLVDKKGEIVNFNAPRPSTGNLLYKDIQSLLDEE